MTWGLVKRLLLDDNMSVVHTALSLIPNDVITSFVFAAAQLPICAYATPKTRTGMLNHIRHLQACSCMWTLHLLLLHTRSAQLVDTLEHNDGTYAPAGKQEDMLLMRGYWQLADMNLCISRVPMMLKVS